MRSPARAKPLSPASATSGVGAGVVVPAPPGLDVPCTSTRPDSVPFTLPFTTARPPTVAIATLALPADAVPTSKVSAITTHMPRYHLNFMGDPPLVMSLAPDRCTEEERKIQREWDWPGTARPIPLPFLLLFYQITGCSPRKALWP